MLLDGLGRLDGDAVVGRPSHRAPHESERTGHARRDGDLTRVTLADGTEIASTDAATGDVAAVVYPWEVTLGPDRPADSAQNHVVGRVTAVVPVANRVRVTVGAAALGFARRAFHEALSWAQRRRLGVKVP